MFCNSKTSLESLILTGLFGSSPFKCSRSWPTVCVTELIAIPLFTTPLTLCQPYLGKRLDYDHRGSYRAVDHSGVCHRGEMLVTKDLNRTSLQTLDGVRELERALEYHTYTWAPNMEPAEMHRLLCEMVHVNHMYAQRLSRLEWQVKGLNEFMIKNHEA